MNTSSPRTFADSKSTIAPDLLTGTLGLLWQCVRLPLFLFLAILEPVVSFVLGSLALLGVLTALFWKLAGPPHFPFLLVLGTSLGFGLALTSYRALLRSLSN